MLKKDLSKECVDDMKGWLQRMGMRLSRMMYGRYGNDRLNRALLVTSLVLLLLAYIPHLQWLAFVALGLLTWSNVRCFSKKIDRRRRELTAFDRICNRVRGFWGLRRKMLKERKTHCYFKCKQCKAVLRVPRGKGEIDVTCPRCHSVTVKKT